MFKIINLTTFPTVSGTFEDSIEGQLSAARELPRTQALLGIFCGSRGAAGHGKDFKIRSAAFLFTLSLSLCSCVFEASYDPCVAITVENLKKRLGTSRLRRERVTRGEKRSKSAILPPLQLISVNSPRGRTEKT